MSAPIRHFLFCPDTAFPKTLQKRFVTASVPTATGNRIPPSTIEAKILFDADKLDVCGAIGIARTLLYKGIVGEPLYTLARDGSVLDGTTDTDPSFFQEYKYKLETIYDHFFTKEGARLAKTRQDAAARYYQDLLSEMRAVYENNAERLYAHIEQ